ncbi:hypothetical protein GCM10023353_23380 [Tomitella cavernea]|uniref:Uncharacterized protein n=1 Tax=Tomitella cavernea TaxID=1387982 RepID=A0ABP9CX18_9ACTN
MSGVGPNQISTPGPNGVVILTRIQYLRWKGAAIVQEWPEDDWMHTPDMLDAIRSVWHAADPFKYWLDSYVNESPAHQY